jgi:hypothetical protein
MHGTRDVSSIKFPFRQLPAHISAWAWIATCSGPGEGEIEIYQDFSSFFFLVLVVSYYLNYQLDGSVRFGV